MYLLIVSLADNLKKKQEENPAKDCLEEESSDPLE